MKTRAHLSFFFIQRAASEKTTTSCHLNEACVVAPLRTLFEHESEICCDIVWSKKTTLKPKLGFNLLHIPRNKRHNKCLDLQHTLRENKV